MKMTLFALVALVAMVSFGAASPISNAMTASNNEQMAVVNAIAADLASMGYTSANAQVFINEYGSVAIRLVAPTGISKQALLEGIFAVETKLTKNAMVCNAYLTYPLTVYGSNGNIVATGLLFPGSDSLKTPDAIAKGIVDGFYVTPL
jgi:hypothetical protein